jgi:drug/metabolite transporter (DMT)-like permease
VVVQVAATLSTAAAALFFGGSPTATDLGWASLAGVGSGVGVGFLFLGFAGGRMSVVAPLSAVGSALVPVVVGLVGGERPGLLVTAAVAAALPGIWLVAGGQDPAPSGGDELSRRGGVLDGALAGLGFGMMFAALGQVSDGAGLWPVALNQAVSAVGVVALASALRQPWRPGRDSLTAVVAGPLTAVATACFQLAARSGLLVVASVLTSLYPAATILLAVAVLHERIHRGQGLGLLLCGLTVTLVAVG